MNATAYIILDDLRRKYLSDIPEDRRGNYALEVSEKQLEKAIRRRQIEVRKASRRNSGGWSDVYWLFDDGSTITFSISAIVKPYACVRPDNLQPEGV